MKRQRRQVKVARLQYSVLIDIELSIATLQNHSRMSTFATSSTDTCPSGTQLKLLIRAPHFQNIFGGNLSPSLPKQAS